MVKCRNIQINQGGQHPDFLSIEAMAFKPSNEISLALNQDLFAMKIEIDTLASPVNMIKISSYQFMTDDQPMQ
jgi:hypothetical protein